MNRPHTYIVPLVISAVLVLDASNVRAADTIDTGPEKKAKIIAFLPSFFDWPAGAAPGPGAPIKVGVLGRDPFQQGAVNHLDQELPGGKFVIERFPDIDKYRPCHILVVSSLADLKPVLEKTREQAVLVIADGLAGDGAVMNLVFLRQLNRLQIEFNPAAAKLAGLKTKNRFESLKSLKIID